MANTTLVSYNRRNSCHVTPPPPQPHFPAGSCQPTQPHTPQIIDQKTGANFFSSRLGATAGTWLLDWPDSKSFSCEESQSMIDPGGGRWRWQQQTAETTPGGVGLPQPLSARTPLHSPSLSHSLGHNFPGKRRSRLFVLLQGTALKENLAPTSSGCIDVVDSGLVRDSGCVSAGQQPPPR